MKVLDLFSGIGGFSLGLERAGFETVAFCERDSFCQSVLKKHWPHVPIFDDVRNLDVRSINADVYAGGFPCTQTSVAASISGNRKGLEGKDSGLWHEYLGHVQTGRPLWVIVENPEGVKKWESEIQNGLERTGYTVSRLALTASDFGLPHLRRRYFYVANRNGKRLEVARQSGSPSTNWVTRLAATGGHWLTGTPGVTGIFNGLPDRVDRIRALGNTVCPAKTEYIGRKILAA